MSRAALSLVGLALLAACATPPAPPPQRAVVAPPPPPVQPAATMPAPVSTAPMVDPVVETVTEGVILDLDDDSDIIGLGEQTLDPVQPTPRPECVPDLEASGDVECDGVPDATDAADIDVDIDAAIDVEPLPIDIPAGPDAEDA